MPFDVLNDPGLIQRAEMNSFNFDNRPVRLTRCDLFFNLTNWNRIFDELPATFTVTQLHAATGANANLMSSVLNRWLKGARIKRVERGTYSKLPWRTAT